MQRCIRHTTSLAHFEDLVPTESSKEKKNRTFEPLHLFEHSYIPGQSDHIGFISLCGNGSKAVQANQGLDYYKNIILFSKLFV